MKHFCSLDGLRTFSHSPRLWLFASAVLVRGAGFLSSFLISRLAGPFSLGVYSATVNTAAAVVQPVVGAVSNSSTLSAVSVDRLGLRRLLMVYLYRVALALLALGVVLLCILDFSGFGGQASGKRAGVWAGLLFLAGFAVMAGSLFTSLASGLLAGAGQFVPLAKVLCGASLLLMFCAYPVVIHEGLRGALVLAILSSCLPAALALALVIKLGLRFPGDATMTWEVAWQESSRHLRASLPSMGALALNSATNWFCTIYLVERIYGPTSVAVIAVGTQWLTLTLMPVTSWGGMVLNELLTADAKIRRNVTSHVVMRLIIRNLVVTAAVAGPMGIASGLIAKSYGLQSHGLPLVLWINVAISLIASVINVMERLFICQDRQIVWLILSAIGLFVQAMVTIALIDRGLWSVPLSIVLANALTLLLAILWGRAPKTRSDA